MPWENNNTIEFISLFIALQSLSAQIYLETKQLTCIKQDRILFEDLNVQFRRGDIIQVAGPNGAGKTSLLRILAGLAQPYEGTIEFDQNNINEQLELYRQNLLYLGHLPGVKSELTAQENLEFQLSLHGYGNSDAEALLADVGLLAFEQSLAGQLSAGQNRRIALAQLWQSNAKVWILDEPFTAIDAKGVEAIEQKILEHANNGGCVILTTHQELNLPSNRVSRLELDYRF